VVAEALAAVAVAARAEDPAVAVGLAPRRVALPHVSADVVDDESAVPGDAANGAAVPAQTPP